MVWICCYRLHIQITPINFKHIYGNSTFFSVYWNTSRMCIFCLGWLVFASSLNIILTFLSFFMQKIIVPIGNAECIVDRESVQDSIIIYYQFQLIFTSKYQNNKWVRCKQFPIRREWINISLFILIIMFICHSYN